MGLSRISNKPRTIVTVIFLFFAGFSANFAIADDQDVDTLRCLVLLVDFDDARGNWDMEELNDILNSPGYTGRLDINYVDYWWEVSRHKLVVVHDIQGPFRAPRNASYYKNQGWREGISSTAEIFSLFADANPDYDWDALSLDDNGRFLGLTIVPSTRIAVSGACHWMGDQFEAPNGVESGQMVGIGIGSSSIFGILHEHGHMLFDWPDLYSVAGGRGTGGYDIMSGQSWSPGVPNAAFLAEQEWIDAHDIVGPQTFTLTENGGEALRFENSEDNDEYFIIEARNDNHPTTRTMPLDRGLLIWHVDKDVGGNYSVNGGRMTLSEHYGVSLEQADGDFDLEYGRNGGEEEDIFTEGDSFNDETTPNSRWWDGTRSGLGIDNIQFLSDNRISFRITAPGNAVSTVRNTTRESGLRVQGDELVYQITSGERSEVVEVTIRLFTVDGKPAATLVHEHKTPGTYTLSLSELERGMYICRMKAGSIVKSVKVLADGH